MKNHGKSRKVTKNHEKIMKNHEKSLKIIKNNEKSCVALAKNHEKSRKICMEMLHDNIF